MRLSLATLSLSTVLTCGCAPADLAGNYTLNLTNRDNGCDFDNWEVGKSTAAIPMTITQEDASINGTVEGLTGAYLNLILGSNVFRGEVAGQTFTMAITGSRSGSKGNCAYTVNATANGSLSTDVISGTISYSAQTNNNSDCGALSGCVSRQEFNGTRPPK